MSEGVYISPPAPHRQVRTVQRGRQSSLLGFLLLSHLLYLAALVFDFLLLLL